MGLDCLVLAPSALRSEAKRDYRNVEQGKSTGDTKLKEFSSAGPATPKNTSKADTTDTDDQDRRGGQRALTPDQETLV